MNQNRSSKDRPGAEKYSDSGMPYRTFEDLEAYHVAREFRKAMYRVNRRLPDFEKFELGSQIRRAAVSLTNNMAEGHGRYHYPERIKFCLNARGSLEELLDDLNVCLDESYLGGDEVTILRDDGWRVHKLLNGYMRWLRDRKQAAGLTIREDSPAYGLNDELIDELLGNDSPPSDSTIQRFNDSTTQG
jgi:four helix bundle protein